MISVKSYHLSNSEKKNRIKEIEEPNLSILECSSYLKPNYCSVIKKNTEIIIDNCHKCIDKYLLNNGNVFSGKLKLGKYSILKDEKVFMGIRTFYDQKSIKVEIFLLKNFPHIMSNGEVYFSNSSLIKKYNKNFHLSSYNSYGMFNRELRLILYELFDLTFQEMVNNF